jgi:hypothetical protein
MGTLCCVSTSLDQKTIETRVKHEGLSFLTITLPDFAKDFERCLELGKVDHTLFRSFAFQRGLPRFLGGYLDQVFDRGTGVLLDVPSEDAIFAIRQISLLFGKILLPCRDDRVKRAFDQYIECELDVIKHQSRFVNHLQSDYARLGSMLFRNLFSQLSNRIYHEELLPKHGRGSTADRILGNKKYRIQEWSRRLDREFPFMDYLSSSYSLALANLSCIDIREPWEERPVRVISVPKTLKTPRIIAMEPSYMQFMQQGILEMIREEVERDNLLAPFLSTKDQTPNQRAALEGSLNGNLATLDLSEASDRVSNLHVRTLMERFPILDRSIQATRSRKADVPGYGLIHLSKFASMGSALCFDMEAAVFLTVVFLGIERSLGHRLTLKEIKSFKGQVRVYGDDIIVPVDHALSVVDCLEAFGFKVNLRKSFWNGKFRESCGKEYYNGHDVSITRVRRLLPTQRQHVNEVESAVSLRNQFYSGGLWYAVRFMDEWLERLIPFRATLSTSPGMGKLSFLGYQTERVHPDLQMPLVKAAVVSRRQPSDKLDDYGALLKFFLTHRREPLTFNNVTDSHFSKNHLERAGRPDSANIKIRWVSSY